MKGASSIYRHIKFYSELRNIIKEAIRDNTTADKVNIPDTFGEPDVGRKNMTVNHWLNFYKDK